MNSDTSKEIAKAIQSGCDLAKQFGGFVAEMFGPSAQDIGEVAHYYTSYWRLCNAIKIEEKVRAKCKEYGIEDKRIPLAPRIGLPMIEAALNEDDDTLQGMWAELMTRSVDPSSANDIRRCHIETLNEFEPNDANIIYGMYLIFNEEVRRSSLDEKQINTGRGWVYDSKLTVNEYLYSIQNLKRLQCFTDAEDAAHLANWHIHCTSGDKEVQIEHKGTLTSHGWELVRLIKDKDFPLRFFDFEPDNISEMIRNPDGSYRLEDIE